MERPKIGTIHRNKKDRTLIIVLPQTEEEKWTAFEITSLIIGYSKLSKMYAKLGEMQAAEKFERRANELKARLN